MCCRAVAASTLQRVCGGIDESVGVGASMCRCPQSCMATVKSVALAIACECVSCRWRQLARQMSSCQGIYENLCKHAIVLCTLSSGALSTADTAQNCSALTVIFTCRMWLVVAGCGDRWRLPCDRAPGGCPTCAWSDPYNFGGVPAALQEHLRMARPRV